MGTKAASFADSDKAEAYEHCLRELPYRAIVYVRENKGTPLYQIAGSSSDALGAENALRAAFAVHKGDCFYCRKPVNKDQFTVDHVEPKALGGHSKHLQNLIVACRPCNQRKGNSFIEAHSKEAGREWLSAVLKQVQQRLSRL